MLYPSAWVTKQTKYIDESLHYGRQSFQLKIYHSSKKSYQEEENTSLAVPQCLQRRTPCNATLPATPPRLKHLTGVWK